MDKIRATYQASFSVFSAKGTESEHGGWSQEKGQRLRATREVGHTCRSAAQGLCIYLAKMAARVHLDPQGNCVSLGYPKQ